MGQLGAFFFFFFGLFGGGCIGIVYLESLFWRLFLYEIFSLPIKKINNPSMETNEEGSNIIANLCLDEERKYE